MSEGQLEADLVAARELIELPENWLKGPAKDDQCCALAALHQSLSDVAGDEAQTRFDAARGLLVTLCGCRLVSAWNDAPERTHAEVIDLFDRAILVAKAQP